MLSRIADSLFWMNRYMERTDGLLRTLRYGYIASFDVNKEEPFSWEPVLTVFSHQKKALRRKLAYKPNDVLRLLTHNTEEHNSIKVMVTRARENARGAQDHITKEVWEAVNQLYHTVNSVDLDKTIENGEQLTMLGHLIDESLSYYGVTDITMPRGSGWNYINLGRYTERCLQTLDIVDVEFSLLDYDMETAQHIAYWKNMLLCLSGYELYLKTYRTGNHNENIIDMAFFNQQFPRSIMYSLKRVGHYLQHILDENEHENKPIIERKMGKLYATIAFADLEEIKAKSLHVFIHSIKKQLFELHKLVGQTFFSYY